VRYLGGQLVDAAKLLRSPGIGVKYLLAVQGEQVKGFSGWIKPNLPAAEQVVVTLLAFVQAGQIAPQND
jgi:hypothetical protein